MGKLFKAFVGFGILCIVVIYIIFGPYMLVRSINDVIQYHQDKDCVIELPAVVTDIDDSVGSEGGTDYHIYVTYNYDGETYNDVHWRQTGYEDDFPVGSTVTVKISENKIQDCNKELQALFETQVEINANKLPIEIFDSIEMTPVQAMNLEPVVDFE